MLHWVCVVQTAGVLQSQQTRPALQPWVVQSAGGGELSTKLIPVLSEEQLPRFRLFVSPVKPLPVPLQLAGMGVKFVESVP